MKKFIFVFLFLFPFLSLSDSLEDCYLELLSTVKSAREINNHIESHISDKRKFNVKRELSMLLDFDVKVDIFKVGHKKVKIISQYDYVFYAEVYKVYLDFNIESDTTIKVKEIRIDTIFKDQEVFDEINTNFKNLYGKYPDFHKLDEFGLSRYRISSSCGAVGSATYRAKLFFEPTANKDINQLNQWLKSINPVHQILGYLGLNFLERSGEQLTKHQIKIMKHLKTRTTMVHTCRGCMVGMKDPMNILIGKDELEKYWKRYNEYLEELNKNKSAKSKLN